MATPIAFFAKGVFKIALDSAGVRLPNLFSFALLANNLLLNEYPLDSWYWYKNSAFIVAISTLLGHSAAQALQLKHKSKTCFNSFELNLFLALLFVKTSLKVFALALVVSVSFFVAL